jgi:hypothetical protein
VSGNFVVYIIERKGPKDRIFAPVAAWGAYRTKREAQVKAKALIAKYPENEYRATGYWDSRPW